MGGREGEREGGREGGKEGCMVNWFKPVHCKCCTSLSPFGTEHEFINDKHLKHHFPQGSLLIG